MKIVAKFLLFGVFVFLPAAGCAQDNFDLLLGQINKVQRQFQDKQFELEMKLQDQQGNIQSLSKGQDALKQSLENAKFDIDFLKAMRGFADTKTDDTSKKLQATEDRLTKAEETIEALNIRLLALEARASKPKAAVRHPRSPINKPTPAKIGTH